MTVFISYSFENEPEFGNIADALEEAGVSHWNPAEVKSGSSLREQLRTAVESCNVCIFIATHSSIKSSWCGAELGAFWGMGKPIVIYLAEASLQEEDLPPLVQGDVWERRIARVVARTKELAREYTNITPGKTLPSTRVGNMTLEQLERIIVGAVSLAAAGEKSEGHSPVYAEFTQAAKGAAGRVLEGLKSASRGSGRRGAEWRHRILWVDDRPTNNVYERNALESMGIEFTLVLSTEEALQELAKQRFAAIISDMGRKEGPREGYVLLEKVRATNKDIPFFIYAGSNAPKHKQEAAHRGAQGSTNSASELVDMVLQAMP